MHNKFREVGVRTQGKKNKFVFHKKRSMNVDKNMVYTFDIQLIVFIFAL